MPSPVLYRIECIAATSDGRPQYIETAKMLSKDNQRPAASDVPFERAAQKAATGAGYHIFSHYTRDKEMMNPSPLVFYALALNEDDEKVELRSVFNDTFGIPTETCIAIEHLIYHTGIVIR